MLVENTKEYHAMMREMDTMEKMNRQREEERANVTADLSDLEGRNDGLQADINELTVSIEAQQSTLDKEMAGKRAGLPLWKKTRPRRLQQCQPLF